MRNIKATKDGISLFSALHTSRYSLFKRIVLSAKSFIFGVRLSQDVIEPFGSADFEIGKDAYTKFNRMKK